MKRLLIYVEDPGGASCLAGTLGDLPRLGIAPRVLAEGAGLTWLQALGESPEQVTEAKLRDCVTTADAILFATSENRCTPAFALAAAAREAGKPVSAYVDARMNFRERFEGPGQGQLKHLPEHLFVFHPETRDLAISVGLPTHAVQLCLHPSFRRIRKKLNTSRYCVIDTLRHSLLPAAVATRPMVIFVAELSEGLQREVMSGPDYTLRGFSGVRGRTEIVLEEVLAALARSRQDISLVLRLHPKQPPDALSEYCAAFDAISHGGDASDLLLASAGVIGMTSALLDEALAVGRPVLSVVPRTTERNWLMMPPPGKLFFASDRDELNHCMLEFMLEVTKPPNQAGIEFQSDLDICDFARGIADWLGIALSQQAGAIQ